MTEIRIGTRGSRLALVQTGMVADALRACLPDGRIETVIIKTKGDRICLLYTSISLFPEKKDRLFQNGKYFFLTGEDSVKRRCV